MHETPSPGPESAHPYAPPQGPPPFAGLPPRMPPPPPPPGARPRKGKKSRGPGPAIVVVLLLAFFGLAFVALVGGLAVGGAPGRLSISKPQIALIRIDGPIMKGPVYDFWMNTLASLYDDPSIEGIVLQLDSPGGSVGSSQEIYDEILRLRGRDGRGGDKIVYASMGDIAASGAYYIAAACDKVVANRGTLTGSIGVIMSQFKVHKLAEDVGVEVESITTGKFKDAGSMFRETSEDERALFDSMLSNAYGQFVHDILREREPAIARAKDSFAAEDRWAEFLIEPLAPEATAEDFLRRVADGRIYTGEQAKDLGLVDELGSLRHTIEILAKDLNIEGKPRIYEPTMKVTFFDLMSAKAQAVLSIPGSWAKTTIQFRSPLL